MGEDGMVSLVSWAKLVLFCGREEALIFKTLSEQKYIEFLNMAFKKVLLGTSRNEGKESNHQEKSLRFGPWASERYAFRLHLAHRPRTTRGPCCLRGQ